MLTLEQLQFIREVMTTPGLAVKLEKARLAADTIEELESMEAAAASASATNLVDLALAQPLYDK